MDGEIRVFVVVVVLSTTGDNRGHDPASSGRGDLQAFHDCGFDLESIFDEEEFWECRVLAEMEHARETGRGWVGKNVEEVGWDAFRPDGYGAAELLEPDLAPVLAHWAGQELELSQDSEPFVEVEFDVLFDGGAEEAAAPASAFAVGDWAADRAPGAEEEEVDVGVHLDG